MATALRPRLSPSSMASRYGSRALALGLRCGEATCPETRPPTSSAWQGFRSVITWESGITSLAVDKSEGVVKDKNVLFGVCDTACSPEKVEDQDPGISR